MRPDRIENVYEGPYLARTVIHWPLLTPSTAAPSEEAVAEVVAEEGRAAELLDTIEALKEQRDALEEEKRALEEEVAPHRGVCSMCSATMHGKQRGKHILCDRHGLRIKERPPIPVLGPKRKLSRSGSRNCACRDCFEIAIGERGALCSGCKEAGCEAGDGECRRPDAYGCDRGDDR